MSTSPAEEQDRVASGGIPCDRCGAALPSLWRDRFPETCFSCLVATAWQEESPEEGTSKPASSQMDAEGVGKTFRGLEIRRIVGRGATGTVYEAFHPGLQSPVALKLLSREIAQDPDFLSRFQREAGVLARLKHPGIVRVLDAGVEEGQPFLVMEWVEGGTLRSYLNIVGCPPTEALRVVREIAEALRHAHEQGIVHRDLKPENIMIDAAGHVRIVDFGLARTTTPGAGTELTRTGFVMGTRPYLAPEQEKNLRQADHRADLYALGVILYELLTGERPQGYPVPPSNLVPVDERVDELVRRALQASPEERWSSAGEFLRHLERIEFSRPRSRQPVLLGLGVAALLLVAMAYALLPRRSAEHEVRFEGGREEISLSLSSQGDVSSTAKAKGDALLPPQSTLSFELMVEATEVEEPWIFLEWEAGPEVTYGIVFFPHGDQTLALFERRTSNPAWGLREKGSLPPDSGGLHKWTKVRVRLSREDGSVEVHVGEGHVLTARIPEPGKLTGAWRLRAAGKGRSVSVRRCRFLPES